MSLSGVKMGFKVTQLSGVYHVFLRIRLFLSTHFRAHVSLGRSQCKREVHGWRDWGRFHNNSLTHFIHIMYWRKKKQPNEPQMFQSILYYVVSWFQLISKPFCFVYTEVPELVSSVIFNFSFLLIPDHLGDKHLICSLLIFFFLKGLCRVEWNGYI